MITTNVPVKWNETRTALVFCEAHSKTPTSLSDMLIHAEKEFPGDSLQEVFETVGFINCAGAGIEPDELLLGPIIRSFEFIEHRVSSSMVLPQVVSLADAVRVAKKHPKCHPEYANVYFIWGGYQLSLIVRHE